MAHMLWHFSYANEDRGLSGRSSLCLLPDTRKGSITYFSHCCGQMPAKSKAGRIYLARGLKGHSPSLYGGNISVPCDYDSSHHSRLGSRVLTPIGLTLPSPLPPVRSHILKVPQLLKALLQATSEVQIRHPCDG